MQPLSTAQDQPGRPRATALVAHSSPLVSLGLIRLLNEQRANVVRVVESMTALQAGVDAPARLLIGDQAGVETCLRDGPMQGVFRGARLIITARRDRRTEPRNGERWLSIDCPEEELLEAIDRLIEGQEPCMVAAASRAGDIGSGLAPGVRRRLLAHIDEHLAEPIEARHLAGMAGLSDGHFARAFKQSFGAPPHRFLMARRIELAAQRVRHTDESLSDIALDFGFSDQSHFTRLFGRLVGATPSAYRSLHLEAPLSMPPRHQRQRAIQSSLIAPSMLKSVPTLLRQAVSERECSAASHGS